MQSYLKIAIIIIYLCSLLPFGVNAQDQYLFNNLSVKDGLSENNITSLLRDSRGFLWIGTGYGLNRYDGQTIIKYTNDINSKNTISSNGIRDLYQDKDGLIWIGTIKELNLYNPRLEKFSHFPINEKIEILKITPHNNDTLYLATTTGLFQFVKATKKYIKIKSQYNHFVLSDMFKESENSYLIASYSHGLFRYNHQTQKFKQLKNLNNDSLQNNLFKQTNSFFKDTIENTLWIADKNNLLKWNTQKKIDIYDISKATMLAQDHTGKNLWIGSSSNLLLFNKKKNHFIKYSHNLKSKKIQILPLLNDYNNILWVGTWGQGLYYFNPYQYQFNCYSNTYEGKYHLPLKIIKQITHDNAGNIYIKSERQGFVIIKQKDHTIKHYTTQNSNLPNNVIESIYADSQNNLWLVNSSKIIKFNIETEKFEPIISDKKQQFSKIIELKPDTYLVTGKKLQTFNLKNKKLTTFSEISIKKPKFLEKNNNHLWFASGSSIYCYNLTTHKLKNYSKLMFNDSIIDNFWCGAFHISPQNNVWLGTDKGIFLFKNDKKQFENFNLKHLSSYIITGIIEHNNHLWVSTNNGLIDYDLKNKKTKIYTQKDGLQSNIFNSGLYDKNIDGTLYFGGAEGLNAFKPQEIKQNPHLPNIIFTDFLINNKSININQENSQLSQSIDFTQQITLTTKDHIFSIEYIAPDFIAGEKIEYAYQLENFDHNWFYTKDKKITYTNIGIDDYFFKIKARNSSGIWSKTRTIKIIVKPLFYQTTIFKIIVIILLGLIIFGIYKIRIITIKKHEKELEKQVKKRTQELKTVNETLKQHKENLEEKVKIRTQELENAKTEAESANRLKTAFLANISHEVRTPLNAIVGFMELIQNDYYPENEKKHFYDYIDINIENLLNLIDDLINIATIESGKIAIKKTNFSINLVLFDILNKFHNELIKQNKINVQLSINEANILKDYEIFTDKSKLLQIFTHLLKNSIKFTEQGFIEIGYEQITEQKQNFFSFYVTDTGTGIKESEQENIFNAFKKSKVNQTRTYSGIGIGLTLCKHYVEALGGKIWLKSIENKGTTIHFTLPIENKIK